jgi:hypothetical protein
MNKSLIDTTSDTWSESANDSSNASLGLMLGHRLWSAGGLDGVGLLGRARCAGWRSGGRDESR